MSEVSSEAVEAAAQLSERTRRDPDGCIRWTGPCNTNGYGVIWVDRQHYVMAHRAAWEMAHGAIADGLVLDHLCRVRNCVNVDHLEPVTNATNVLRGIGVTAINRRKRACIHGHPYDEKNTYWRPDGARGCWECKRATQRRLRAARIARTETKGGE